MSESMSSACGVPLAPGERRWSMDCAISRSPGLNARMAGRLSPRASESPSTPGPCHLLPSKYTIAPTQIEPVPPPPVERLEVRPSPAGSRKDQETGAPESVASRGELVLGAAAGPTPLFGWRFCANAGLGLFEKGPLPVGRNNWVLGEPGSTLATSSVVA